MQNLRIDNPIAINNGLSTNGCQSLSRQHFTKTQMAPKIQNAKALQPKTWKTIYFLLHVIAKIMYFDFND